VTKYGGLTGESRESRVKERGDKGFQEPAVGGS